MKAIVIKDFLKYTNTDKINLDSNNINLVFKSGYWNVLKYNNDLELFLKNNKIDYYIKTY
jgi:hypothetical protein